MNIIPENSGEAVREILKKFELEQAQNDSIALFFASKGKDEEKTKILESSPGFILAQVVRDYAEDKINLEKLPNLIKDSLKVTDKKADQIAKELKDKILDFIKPAADEPTEKPIEKSTESPKPSRKSDTYREQVE